VGSAGTAVGTAVVGEVDGSGVGFKGTDVGVGSAGVGEESAGSTQQPTTNTRENTPSAATTWPIDRFDRNDLTPKKD
jgi:hypothetical protein